MAYYNRDGQKFDTLIKDMDYINHGCCANIYKLKDKDVIFKKYLKGTGDSLHIRPLLFDELKSINNKHFIELYDLYCKMNKEQLLLYKKNEFSFATDAYTAKYYEPKDINILYESIDYFLTNLYELEMLFNEFADNGIEVDDVKVENTVITSDGIVIIDPDLFHGHEDHTYNARIINKSNLVDLFKHIFRLHILADNKNNYTKFRQNVVFGLLSFDLDEDPNLTDTVTKKLKYVKRPIDYIMK